MAINLSIRLNDDDEERLDRLVIAWRAYYERQELPAAQRLAKEVTRSSALRDLLSAWHYGFMPTDVAKGPINDE